MTVSVTGASEYVNPGNFDPVVNTNLQIQLQERANKAFLQRTKNKIAIVINALQSVFLQMDITGRKAWWDNTHFQAEIPENVGTLCNARRGAPNPSDCERASFNLIRGGLTPTITPRKPIVFQSGKDLWLSLTLICMSFNFEFGSTGRNTKTS